MQNAATLAALLVLGAAVPARAGDAPPTADAVFATCKGDFCNTGPAGPFYPARAYEQRVEGVAVIDCQLGAEGRLDKCKVVSDTPRDYAFGLAALAMARRGWITVPAADGSLSATSGPMRVRVPFDLPKR